MHNYKKVGLPNWVSLICCIIALSLMTAGLLYAQQLKNTDKENKKEIEVLYYDKSEGIKVINKKGFLLKIEKNEKGLKIVHELGPYPDAYPPELPAPGTHIDDESE
jgi:hypothetical protein